MKKNDLREKIHLTSVDELFGLENAESSIEIGIDRIRSFKDHPSHRAYPGTSRPRR